MNLDEHISASVLATAPKAHIHSATGQISGGPRFRRSRLVLIYSLKLSRQGSRPFDSSRSTDADLLPDSCCHSASRDYQASS
eukprot:1753592-Karenia_brevis.AAC.1